MTHKFIYILISIVVFVATLDRCYIGYRLDENRTLIESVDSLDTKWINKIIRDQSSIEDDISSIKKDISSLKRDELTITLKSCKTNYLKEKECKFSIK